MSFKLLKTIIQDKKRFSIYENDNKVRINDEKIAKTRFMKTIISSLESNISNAQNFLLGERILVYENRLLDPVLENEGPSRIVPYMTLRTYNRGNNFEFQLEKGNDEKNSVNFISFLVPKNLITVELFFILKKDIEQIKREFNQDWTKLITILHYLSFEFSIDGKCEKTPLFHSSDDLLLKLLLTMV